MAEQTYQCIGCGATIQTEQEEAIGYLPNSALQKGIEKGEFYCQRCFRLRNYNELQDVAIDDDVANIIQAQLLFLASNDSSSDISLYVNTPGGQVTSGLGIYDTMQLIEPDVATICTGMAASMGSVILCAGAPGKRSALPHSRVMIHQPLGGAQGQATEIMIAAKEIEKTRRELYQIISDHSGQPYEKIASDAERDFWLTASEALEYGMVDEILTKKSK